MALDAGVNFFTITAIIGTNCKYVEREIPRNPRNIAGPVSDATCQVMY